MMTANASRNVRQCKSTTRSSTNGKETRRENMHMGQRASKSVQNICWKTTVHVYVPAHLRKRYVIWIFKSDRCETILTTCKTLVRHINVWHGISRLLLTKQKQFCAIKSNGQDFNGIRALLFDGRFGNLDQRELMNYKLAAFRTKNSISIVFGLTANQ